MKSNKDDESKEGSFLEQPASEGSRREFLRKAGKFAAYTTPGIVALMLYDERAAAGDLPPVS